MKKFIIIAIALLYCLPTLLYSSPAFAQTEEQEQELPWLVGLDFGLGLPAEYYDLNAVGLNAHLTFDFAHPVKDDFAMGFYIGVGGGFMGAVHPYSEYDRFYIPFKLSAGLLMEIGDLKKRPVILGIGPCTGLGFVDMDLVLPAELRFGRFISEHWYILVELSYGVSLAHETVYFEPSVRIGYNFGHKKKKNDE